MTPEDEDADPHDGRHETLNERLDRNWAEMMQELRVLQTGTQILTGFILTLAFQPRFATLQPYQIDAYLVLVVVAASTTILGLVPVALHRGSFALNDKREIVKTGNRIMRALLVSAALTLVGMIMLIFDEILGFPAGPISGLVALVVVTTAWLALPNQVRKNFGRRDYGAENKQL